MELVWVTLVRCTKPPKPKAAFTNVAFAKEFHFADFSIRSKSAEWSLTYERPESAVLQQSELKQKGFLWWYLSQSVVSQSESLWSESEPIIQLQ